MKPGHPILAALLDFAMWPVRPVRSSLIPLAHGRVLAVGVGTGANLPFYTNAESIVGIDPDPYMLARARKRASRLDLRVELVQQEAERLPFAAHSFDTVVATWVLCTIEDPARALDEMQRVLAPNGLLLYAEHVRSRFSGAAKLQRALTPLWKRLAGGCHLDRDALGLIRQAGFAPVSQECAGRERWTLAPVYWGTAICSGIGERARSETLGTARE